MEAPTERLTERVLEHAWRQRDHRSRTCSSAPCTIGRALEHMRYFPNDPPARIFVCVPAWPGPLDIEVDGIAIRNEQ